MEFKHYKGKIYWLNNIATHTETEEKFAIYTDKDGNVWARPLEMFHENVKHNGKTMKRFQLV
jgi:hypothetical protein